MSVTTVSASKSAEQVFEAARQGGDYLLRHLGADGRFEYEYDTVHDTSTTSHGYSLPRHAGATRTRPSVL